MDDAPRPPADAIPADPLAVFGEWLFDAEQQEPDVHNACSLATVDAQGRPSVRIVLLKHFDERGFEFFTSHDSRKGREIAGNPNVALCFHWKSTGRQVRIEGRAEPLDDARSDAYWASRHPDAQLSASISDQSQPVASRVELEARREARRAELAGAPVPRPPFWGGYRIVARRIELWVSRAGRLHDRFLYERFEGDWAASRLQP